MTDERVVEEMARLDGLGEVKRIPWGRYGCTRLKAREHAGSGVWQSCPSYTWDLNAVHRVFRYLPWNLRNRAMMEAKDKVQTMARESNISILSKVMVLGCMDLCEVILRADGTWEEEEG